MVTIIGTKHLISYFFHNLTEDNIIHKFKKVRPKLISAAFLDFDKADFCDGCLWYFLRLRIFSLHFAMCCFPRFTKSNNLRSLISRLEGSNKCHTFHASRSNSQQNSTFHYAFSQLHYTLSDHSQNVWAAVLSAWNEFQFDLKWLQDLYGLGELKISWC